MAVKKEINYNSISLSQLVYSIPRETKRNLMYFLFEHLFKLKPEEFEKIAEVLEDNNKYAASVFRVFSEKRRSTINFKRKNNLNKNEIKLAKVLQH